MARPPPGRGCAVMVAACVAALTTACGFVHVHFGSSGGSAPAGPANYRAEIAYAQCMRAHGLPGFPNPNPSGGPRVHYQRRPTRSAHLNGTPNSPAARANDACEHLLAGGSTGTGSATAPAFQDVTMGTNTVTSPTQTITGHQAAPGWDPVTGWGSPNAQLVVPLLARYVSP